MKVAKKKRARKSAEQGESREGAEGRSTPKKTKKTKTTSPTADAPFRITLRGMHQPALEGMVIEAESAPDALQKALSHDVGDIVEPILTWEERKQLLALDFDRPPDAEPLRDADVQALATICPAPIAAWATHDAGLRVIFASVDGATAPAIAGAWFLTAPLGLLRGWRVEVKTDTRHPAGMRDGARCGRVFLSSPTANISLGSGSGTVSPAEVGVWMSGRGLTVGRHGAERCPWQCSANSGNPPVVVDENGIRCYRCKRSGTWAEIVHGDVDEPGVSLHHAARSLVHVDHQQHVIRGHYPSIPETLIAPAYGLVLLSANADRLKRGSKAQRATWKYRVARATRGAPKIARSSSGAWLDARTLSPRGKVTPDKTLRHLPWCQSPPMVDEADDNGLLEGFTPLHPIGANEVLAPGVLAPTGSVFVRRPNVRGDGGPVDLSRRPSVAELADAWTQLEQALPGICRDYHFAILVAMLVAQRGVGTPPMICATGQSGSGKTAQVHLAASALGSRAGQITLGSTDDTTRKAGLELEQGAGVLFADEIGRVDGLFTKLEPILSANSVLSYRPKYKNERRTPMRAAVMLLGSTLPEAIVRSPELSRRAVAFRLAGAEKLWSLVDPSTEVKVDLSAARTLPALRVALDVVTAHAWFTVLDLGASGDWRSLLIERHNAVPLRHLDLVDTDGEAHDSAIIDLYEQYRNAADADLSRIGGHVGWLIADPGTETGDRLSVLVDLDGEPNRFKAATSDLERLHLAPILGIREPQLQLLIRKRPPHVLAKFVVVGTMRGRGPARRELPPARRAPKPADGGKETVTL